MSSELGWEYFPGFAGSAMQKLANHDWPGNIRELKNAVERSLHRWGDGTREVGEIVIDPFIKPWQEEAPPASIQADQASAPQAQTPAVTDFHAHMEALEKRLLQQALAENGGHQRRTAQALGLSYDQMRGMVRKHGLSRRRRG